MKKKILAYILMSTLVFAGCSASDSSNSVNNGNSSNNAGNTNNSENNNNSEDSSTTIVAGDVTFATESSEMFTDRDYEVGYDEATSINIQLNGDSISCASDAVQVNGTTAILLEEATYIISGTLNDGMIVVNVGEKDKPQIVLNGVTINSETSAPIYVLEGDKIFVTLADGTTNTLTNGGSFEAIDENDIDAVIFSKQDLTLNGSGSLVVESPAGHGIVSKDDLVLTSGTYDITSASKGLDANDSVRIANANITIASGKDGIHAENSDDANLGFVYIASGNFDISAEGDGISAGAYMQIEGGLFDIISGGGSENATKSTSDSWGMMGGGKGGMGGRPDMPNGGFQPNSGSDSSLNSGSSSDSSEDSTSIKAIKSSLDMLISNGTFTIDSADDAVHSNINITINGGTFEIASGDDAFHADETLFINAGTINITESYEGLEGLHVQVAGGDVSIISSDDGINAAGGTDSSGAGGFRGGDMFGGMGGNSNGSVVISGGSIYMNASGDGIDANGTLEISGGYTVVCGPTNGDTAVLDYDTSAVITGGTFIGTGASMMAQTFSSSSQGVVAVSVGSQSAGTEIKLEDSEGNVVVTCEPKLSYQIVILSTPDMVSGEEYTITVGSATGTFEAN